MKKLLLLAAAALLLLPVHAQAYSISYDITHVDDGLEYAASVEGNTLSFFAKSITAVKDATIVGTYTITADPGDAPTLEDNSASFDYTLTGFFNSDLSNKWADMTRVKLAYSLPGSGSRDCAFVNLGGPESDTISMRTGEFQTGVAYDFSALFTNVASGYGEASFTMTVPQSATPIPGAVWLLGSGLVGLVGVRRRMKNGDA